MLSHFFSYNVFKCGLCKMSFIDEECYLYYNSYVCEGCSKKILECYVCDMYCTEFRNFFIPNEIITICFKCLKKQFYSSFTWCHKCLLHHNNNSKYCIYCDVNKYDSFIDLLPLDIKRLISNLI